SWGYFDYRMQGEGYDDGFQSAPVNWGISSARKRSFFGLVKEITSVPDGRKSFPDVTWEERKPAAAGMDKTKLDALKNLVGGRGCVVRHGAMVYTWGDVAKSDDLASAAKPVISTLLFFAVQEGKLKSVDDLVADFEPRLKELNSGKDAAIT